MTSLKECHTQRYKCGQIDNWRNQAREDFERGAGRWNELFISRGEDGQLLPKEKKRREISVQNQLRSTGENRKERNWTEESLGQANISQKTFYQGDYKIQR